MQNKKGGYFTVHINVAGDPLPYIVFAESDYHAARKVKHETGYMARQHEVEGPYNRINFDQTVSKKENAIEQPE